MKSLTARLLRGGGRVVPFGVKGTDPVRESTKQTRDGLEPFGVWACEQLLSHYAAQPEEGCSRGGGIILG